MDDDLRWHSAAAERNQGPITAQLQRLLPPRGLLLEIASGTGQHAAHAAAALPGWRWQPSDADPGALASIGAWCRAVPGVLRPLPLDVMASAWPGVPAAVDAIFCANLIHIAPWPVCPALMQGAARHLSPAGLLVLYGPYLEAGVPTAPSNEAFDADLRSRNPAWGLRRLDAVLAAAHDAGLRWLERQAMPSNNLMLVFKPAGQASLAA